MSTRWFILVLFVVFCGGCGGVNRAVHGLVRVPFDVASHVAVNTARAPIEAAKIGAVGVAHAVLP